MTFNRLELSKKNLVKNSLNIIRNKKTITLTLTLITSFFILTLLPLNLFNYYNNYDYQRILQITLLLFLNIILFVNLSYKANEINSKTIIPSILFFITGIASSIFSDKTYIAIFYTSHIFLLTTCMILISLFKDKKLPISFILALTVAHTILILTCSLNIAYTIFAQRPLDPYIIYSGFINIRFFNQVQVFILPFLILLLRFKDIQRIVFLVLFLNLLLIFIGQARGALLSFFVISIFSIIFKSTLKKQFITGLVCLFMSFIAFYCLDSLTPSGTDILRKTTSGRIDLWLETIKSLTYKHIFIGSGPGIFESSLRGGKSFSHPHNSLIEVLNEWGGIALIILLSTVLYTIKKALSHINQKKGDIITESLFYSFLIGIIYSLFSGVHVMPLPQTLLFIIWGLLIGRLTSSGYKTVFILNYKKNFIITISLIIIWCFYMQKAVEIYNNIDFSNSSINGPRFWSVGKSY